MNIRILKTAGKCFATLSILLIVFVIGYAVVSRASILSWGLSLEERTRAYPGDELMPGYRVAVTRAVTITAPPEKVWPWILQIGQERGGFYSYDWMENLINADIHNIFQIRPEFQKERKPGDTIWFAGKNGSGPGVHYIIGTASSGRMISIVSENDWNSIKNGGTSRDVLWSFIVLPVDYSSSRLIARMLSLGNYPIVDYLIEIPHFIMERKMVLTIKQLAESGTIAKRESAKEGVWFATLIISALGILIVAFMKKWPYSIGTASMCTVAWVAVLCRGYPSPVWGSLLVIFVVGCILFLHRRFKAAGD